MTGAARAGGDRGLRGQFLPGGDAPALSRRGHALDQSRRGSSRAARRHGGVLCRQVGARPARVRSDAVFRRFVGPRRHASAARRPIARRAAWVATEGQPADPRLDGTPFAAYPQRENFLLAAAWWRASGLDESALYDAAGTFRLGRHRLARVAEIDGVTFWNDSKATNFHAVEAALGRFSSPVRLIAGGKSKGGDIGGFVRRIAPRVRQWLPDRRDGGGAGGGVRRGRGVPTFTFARIAWPTRCGRRARRRSRETTCCSARGSPASTNSATTRTAATSSSAWCASGSHAAGPCVERRRFCSDKSHRCTFRPSSPTLPS